MKKTMGVLVALLLALLACPALAQQAEEWTEGCQWVGQEPALWTALKDGDASTALTGKRGKQLQLHLRLPEGAQAQTLYLAADPAPRTVTVKTKQNGKWREAASVAPICAQMQIPLPAPVSGEVLLTLSYDRQTTPTVAELRLFGAGELPQELPCWQRGAADVLYVQGAGEMCWTQVAAWASAHPLAVALPSAPAQGELLLWLDRLWAAGVRNAPYFGGFAPSQEQTEKQLTAWATEVLRSSKPLCLLLPAGEDDGNIRCREVFAQAREMACDTSCDAESAAALGVWYVPRMEKAGAADLTQLPERSAAGETLRARYAGEFAGAVHSDPALIPYPEERGTDGYLSEGEFIYENETQGLWAYLSPTVQVEIVRYEETEPLRVWFEAEVRFDPAAEQFASVVFGDAAFEGQQTYPETLAQREQLVLAINGDYYPYRADRKYTVGNIIRRGQVLYNYEGKRNRAYPVLDNLVLWDDGTLSVHALGEVTANEIAAQGGAHDMFSFGPILVRNDVLQVYTGSHCDANEPRMSIGMMAPGHYRIIMAEGRIPGGPAGIDLNTLARLQYCRGAKEAFNLDGGNTAVLLFMGRKLNRTGAVNGQGLGSPRNMHELVGVGRSAQVHTDMVDGKKK